MHQKCTKISTASQRFRGLVLRLLPRNVYTNLPQVRTGKRGTNTALCVPHRQNSHLVTERDIVDMIASRLELSRIRRVSGTGDCRCRRPMYGACPRSSNAAVSSSANRSGAALRFFRHQLSITRICESASGVVRTGRVTAVGATRLEFSWLSGDDPLRRTATKPTVSRAGRGAPRQ